jgi:signal transduction histidine kinase
MTNIKQGPTTVKISIIDFGKGIDPETLSLIKLGRSVSKGKDETYDGGTGIGLSSAFRYIHEAGGNIEVESNVGTGTTIRVSLPIIFKDRT